MTPRSIRRAAERKARKQAERKAKNIPTQTEALPSEDLPEVAFERPTLSAAKLQANRGNAQLSTGPTSPDGRAKSSLNAVKTALTGRTVLLPSDDAAEYESFLQAFIDEYSPVGPRESDLVQSIADTRWRMRRIPCLEAALYAHGSIEFADAFEEQHPSARPSLNQAQAFLKYEKQLRNLQLQEARLFRRYEKERAELRQLQQERRSQEADAEATATAPSTNPPNEFGFEFSTTPSNPPPTAAPHLNCSETRAQAA